LENFKEGILEYVETLVRMGKIYANLGEWIEAEKNWISALNFLSKLQ
jgi:hypothetical protein